MDWALISWKVGVICLLLAIIAIGFPYIPISRLFNRFFRRKPSPKDTAMIRRIFGLLTIPAFLFLIWATVSLACDFVFGYATSIVEQTNLCHPLLFRFIIGVAILLIIAILLWWFMRMLWRIAKKMTPKEFEPTDIQRLTTEIRRLRRDFNQLSRIVDTLHDNILDREKARKPKKRTNRSKTQKEKGV
jgi:Na+-transporting methylmalonyl-CoA/oxaloacetate decarboxylase gamma subunit